VIVSFRVRPQAAAEFGHKSTGGPATSLAQGLHAQLYGLPADPDPLPAALDALLQATHAARTGEQKAAILQRLADQLRNAAEILQRYQYDAQWDRFPADVAAQLRQAHDRAKQIADALDDVTPVFIDAPSNSASLAPQQNRTPATTSPASTTAPPPGRRR
jgi:N-acyl-D-aspartate/D-glutamate deacylase